MSFLRLRTTMDIAIQWKAVSVSFAVTLPRLHLRFARLKRRSTSTRHIHQYNFVSGQVARPFSVCQVPDRITEFHVLCKSSDYLGYGKFCRRGRAPDNARFFLGIFL